jgi:RHH-type rel operon transcriptional repressor/antitoxin RelB
MSAVHIPKELDMRLDHLVSRTKHTRSYYVKKAIEKYLEDEEDYIEAVASYEEHVRSGHPGYTLEEMKKICGIE